MKRNRCTLSSFIVRPMVVFLKYKGTEVYDRHALSTSYFKFWASSFFVRTGSLALLRQQRKSVLFGWRFSFLFIIRKPNNYIFSFLINECGMFLSWNPSPIFSIYHWKRKNKINKFLWKVPEGTLFSITTVIIYLFVFICCSRGINTWKKNFLSGRKFLILSGLESTTL
jgi:hypothetical protein